MNFGKFFSFITTIVSLAALQAQNLVISTVEPVTSVAALPNGQFLVSKTEHVTRYNSDGSVDLDFLPAGFRALIAVENDLNVLVNDPATIQRFNPEGLRQDRFRYSPEAFLLQPDGDLVIWSRSALLRLKPDGELDSSFASNSVPAAGHLSLLRGHSLALQENGKILLAPTSDGSILRFNTDGTPDASFQAPKVDPAAVAALLVQPNGQIVIGGQFKKLGEHVRTALARLNADGSLDLNFAPVFADGADVTSLALQANGKILVAGHFRSINGLAVTNVARLHSDGTLDPSLSLAPFDPVEFNPVAVALQGDGGILAGGSLTVVRATNSDPAEENLMREGDTLTWLRGGSSPEIYHARFQTSPDGINWSDLGAGERIDGGWRLAGAALPSEPRVRARGYVTGTSYYVDSVLGGPEILAQHEDRTNDVGTTSIFSVYAHGEGPLQIQWFKDGQALTGPTTSRLALTNVTGADSGNYYAVIRDNLGSATSRVAHLTVVDPLILQQPAFASWLNAGTPLILSVKAAGTGISYQWKRDGVAIPGATSSTLTLPNAEAADAGDYRVTITAAYGSLDSEVAAVHVNFALPDSWNPQIEATTEYFPIQAAAVLGEHLVIGGLFRTLTTPSLHHLVKFRSGDSVDPGFAPEPLEGEVGGVTALSFTPDDKLLVGGNFLTIAGEPQSYLARLAADGSLDQQFRPVLGGKTGGLYTLVSGFDLQPDERIRISGVFSSVNGQPQAGKAQLLPDGSLDPSFDSGSSEDEFQAWQTDGKRFMVKLVPIPPTITVVGDATTTSGGNQYVIARVNPDGTEDPSFCPFFDNYATIKAMETDGSLIVAGNFRKAAGASIPTLVRIKNPTPATQTLSFEGGTITWLRGGSSPEVARTTFEFSADGQTWSSLGAGTRISGGWQLSGLQLGRPGTLRARGFARGSIYETTLRLGANLTVQLSGSEPEGKMITLNTSGSGEATVTLEMSTDLNYWTSLQTNSVSSAPIQINLAKSAAPWAFYRLRLIAK